MEQNKKNMVEVGNMREYTLDYTKQRLRNVLVYDKLQFPEHITKILEEEVGMLLQNYMALNQPPHVEISIEQSGNYQISMHASAHRLKQMGLLGRT